jgi:hypothetical protein
MGVYVGAAMTIYRSKAKKVTDAEIALSILISSLCVDLKLAKLSKQKYIFAMLRKHVGYRSPQK